MMLRHALPTLCAACLLCALGAATSHADILIFKNGVERVGIVKDSLGDPTRLIFTDHRGTVTIPRANISKITPQEEHVAWFAIGDGYLKLGNHEKAIEVYRRAGALGASAAETLARIDKVKVAQEAKANQSRKDDLAKIDELLIEADEHIKQNRFDKADRVYEETTKLDPTDEQKKAIARRQIELHMAWGQWDLDHINPSGASQHFEQVLKWDNNHAPARKALIGIRKDDPSRRAEVVDFLAQELVQDPGNRKTRRELADGLVSLGRYNEALEHYMRLTQGLENLPEELGLQIENCYVAIHTSLANEGRTQEARDVYVQYMEMFSGVDPEPLHVYDYSLKRAQILRDTKATTDPARLTALAELGYWCRANNLHGRAKKEFQYVLAVHPTNLLATKGLNLYARDSLSLALTAEAKSRYDEAIRLAKTTIKEHGGYKDVVNEARDLIERSETELDRKKIRRRQDALRYADLGDEYYATAMTHIANIQSLDSNPRATMIRDHQEAARFLDRAVESWNQALKIDSSLRLKTEANLGEKIADARRYRARLLKDPTLPSKPRNLR